MKCKKIWVVDLFTSRYRSCTHSCTFTSEKFSSIDLPVCLVKYLPVHITFRSAKFGGPTSLLSFLHQVWWSTNRLWPWLSQTCRSSTKLVTLPTFFSSTRCGGLPSSFNYDYPHVCDMSSTLHCKWKSLHWAEPEDLQPTVCLIQTESDYQYLQPTFVSLTTKTLCASFFLKNVDHTRSRSSHTIKSNTIPIDLTHSITWIWIAIYSYSRLSLCLQANLANSPCFGLAGPMGLRSRSGCHVFT